MDITVRYATTDDDVINIHKFLSVVAGPTLPGPIDAKDSAIEIWRVVNHDVALMAMRGDLMVGTLGIVRPSFWWNNKIGYLANRWLFTIPGSRCVRALIKEGCAIARASNLEFHIIDENKDRLVIFNKSHSRAAR